MKNGLKTQSAKIGDDPNMAKAETGGDGPRRKDATKAAAAGRVAASGRKRTAMSVPLADGNKPN